MAYFTKDFAKFFKELESNNNRDWFQENKKRYEQSVKLPFEAFVSDMIGIMDEVYPGIDITPKECIFRINRDIRFSKDKSPYKNHMAALVSPGGRKDMVTPAMYLQVNHVDIRVYSGCHNLEKEQLHSLRSHIAKNQKEFNTLISSKAFKDTFGEVLGEKNKRIPPEFVDAAEKQPLIANKAFYYFFKEKPSRLTDDNLAKSIFAKFKKAQALNAFLTKGIQG